MNRLPAMKLISGQSSHSLLHYPLSSIPILHSQHGGSCLPLCCDANLHSEGSEPPTLVPSLAELPLCLFTDTVAHGRTRRGQDRQYGSGRTPPCLPHITVGQPPGD